MLFRLIEMLKKTDNLTLPQKGIVVDNVDPLKLNRVKCIIKGLIETDNYENLPWIHPVLSSSSPSSTSTHPPEISTELWIEFPNGLYQPIYRGYWYSVVNGISHPQNPSTRFFGNDYPHCYGSQDSTGNYYVVNKKQETIDWEHSSADHIRINRNGEIILTGKHKIFVNNESDISLTSLTGNINITALQKVVIKGTAGVDVEGSLVRIAPNNTIMSTLQPVINGVITGMSTCIVTGTPHALGSPSVLASHV